MRSFNELLQSPRALKMLLAGGSVMTLLLIGLLVAPAWVRSKLEREARARGFEAHVEGVSFGLTRVWARGVRLTSPGSDFELKLDAVGVGVSSNEVVAHGGTLRGSGDPDPILRKLRGRSERPVDGEGGSSGRALELEGLYLQWRRGGMTLEAFGVRASRNAEGASAGADLLRVVEGKRTVEVRQLAVGVASSGGKRRLNRLETSALELSIRREEPAAAVLSGRSEANPKSAPGETQDASARAERLRALRSLVLPLLRDGLEPGASLTLNGVAARVERAGETLSFGPSRLLLSRDEQTLRIALSPSTTEAGSTPLSLSLELPLSPAPVHLLAKGGPVSLSSLGMRPGQLGLRDVNQATLAADGSLSLSEDFETLALDGKLALHGLTLQRAELSSQPVGPWSVEVALKAQARLDASELRVLSSEAHVGEVRAELSGVLNNGAQRHIEGRLRVPLSGCQSVLDAMPNGLVPLVKNMKLAGSFGVDLQVRYDQAKPEDTRVALTVQNECRVREVPSELDPHRFERPFTRVVKGPDGSPVTIDGGPGTQSWVSIEDISRYMESAILVCEDGGFHSHAGFDFRALESAIKDDLKQGRFARGGSTVSMQLAKNLYLGTEKTLGRKVQEALLTMLLEQQLDKRRILELYLNVVELGPGLYGVGDAAHYYFATPARALTLGQSLYLASLLPNPTYSRFGADGKLNPGWSAYLRKLMHIAHKRKRIDDAELEAGLAEEIAFRVPGKPQEAELDAGEAPAPPELGDSGP